MTRRTHITQYSFDKGLIDPELLGRRDIRAYAGSLLAADNMTGVIGGPITRRGGLQFVAEVPHADQGARLAPFQFGEDQRYLMVFTDRRVDVYHEDQHVTPVGVETPFTGSQVLRMDYDQSLDTMLLCHEDVPAHRLQRQGSDDAWDIAPIAFRNIPGDTFGHVSQGQLSIPSKSGSMTLTSAADDFASASIGDRIRVNNGRLTITGVTNSRTVTAKTDYDLDNSDDAEAGDWSLEEDVWSDARGWPRAVHLSSNRSFWGGSKLLLQRVWGSASGGVDIFDFTETKDRLEDEFVEDDLVGSQVNAVGHIIALGDQFVLTTGGTFVNVVDDQRPVSVESFRLRKNHSSPMAPIKPVTSDGAITCILADGEGVPISCAEIVYDVQRESYVADDLNVLSAHVMRKPVDLAARFSDGSRGMHHRFIVNADGTVALHHSMRRQEVKGWTLWRSPGASGNDKVLRVAVIGNVPYFLIRREIAGNARYFIEKLDNDGIFDSAIKQVTTDPVTVIEGLDHLEGEEVHVFADGALRDPAHVIDGRVAVTDGGEPYAAREIEAGVPFSWRLMPVPVEAQIADRTLVGQKHRLISVTLELNNAYPFFVNGRRVAFRRFGDFRLDQPVKGFSGRHHMRFLGWNRGEGSNFDASGTLPVTFLSVVAEAGQ